MNAKNDTSSAPLHVAAPWNHVDMKSIFSYYQSNMKYQDQEGKCSLHLAVKNSNLKIIKLFLSNKQQINRNLINKRQTIHMITEGQNNKQIKKQLFQKPKGIGV